MSSAVGFFRLYFHGYIRSLAILGLPIIHQHYDTSAAQGTQAGSSTLLRAFRSYLSGIAISALAILIL